MNNTSTINAPRPKKVTIEVEVTEAGFAGMDVGDAKVGKGVSSGGRVWVGGILMVIWSKDSVAVGEGVEVGKTSLRIFRSVTTTS